MSTNCNEDDLAFYQWFAAIASATAVSFAGAAVCAFSRTSSSRNQEISAKFSISTSPDGTMKKEGHVIANVAVAKEAKRAAAAIQVAASSTPKDSKAVEDGEYSSSLTVKPISLYDEIGESGKTKAMLQLAELQRRALAKTTLLVQKLTNPDLDQEERETLMAELARYTSDGVGSAYSDRLAEAKAAKFSGLSLVESYDIKPGPSLANMQSSFDPQLEQFLAAQAMEYRSVAAAAKPETSIETSSENAMSVLRTPGSAKVVTFADGDSKLSSHHALGRTMTSSDESDAGSISIALNKEEVLQPHEAASDHAKSSSDSSEDRVEVRGADSSAAAETIEEETDSAIDSSHQQEHRDDSADVSLSGDVGGDS